MSEHEVELTDLKADNERLRKRIHEAVDECQRRHAPYVSRCAQFDVTAEWFRESLVRQGYDEKEWTWNSVAMRVLAIKVVEERDTLAARLADAEARAEAALRLADEWEQATCITDGAPCSFHRHAAGYANDLREALRGDQ